MTVVVTDNRTDPTNGQADSTTGWTGSIAPSLVTSNPNPVELTGSLGQVVSTTIEDIELAITSRNMSAGELVYVWCLANGIMDTQVNGGQGVLLHDGTNQIGYHVAGSDKAAFRHNSKSVGWQCMLLDTGSLPANFTARAGAEASLVLTAITAVGAMYKTLAKSVGGAVNCFTDIIRIGNGGITITGGGTGTEGTFLEIATEDSSDVSLKAYGICHEVASGVFGLQGALTFGDSAGTLSVDFKDQDVTVVFEDRGIGTDKYKITIANNATGNTDFQLGIKVGTDGGSNGCSLTCPVGVGAAFDASDTDVELVLLYGGQFANYDQLFKFSSDATNGPNHEVFGYTFSGCAQIDIGLVKFENNTIVNTVDANGGILGNRSLTNLTFISDGTGHAIYITSPGTYSYAGLSFSGYGADGTTDAVVYNNSGGLVTLNIASDSDTPTVRNGTSATTSVVISPVTLTVTTKDSSVSPPTVIESAAVTVKPTDATGPLPYRESVTITQTGGTATVAHTGHGFSVGQKVEIEGANENDYNRIKTILTVPTVDSYTYAVPSATASPATGTITATAIIIDGLTDVNGEIADTRTYTANQPITGAAKKGSSDPVFKSTPISNTIDKSNGLSVTTLMNPD